MNQAVIRPGRDADAAGFIALIGDCWAEYPNQVFDVDGELPELHALASYFRDVGGALWTAEACGAVVGMVGTYPAEDGWHLSRMYVRPGQRGTGLAAALIRTAEQHARAAGGTRMVLWSDVLFERAHAFYEKHGFVRRGGLRALGDLSNSIEAGFAKPLSGLVVEALDVAAAQSAERGLAALLIHQAEPVPGFLHPIPVATAQAYWHDVTRAVGQDTCHLFAAWSEGVLCGALQMLPASDLDGGHRAGLAMLLGDPASAAALATAAEAAARGLRRTLLVTRSAEPGFWRGLGWTEAGTVPDYTAGGIAATTLFKTLN